MDIDFEATEDELKNYSLKFLACEILFNLRNDPNFF